MGPRQGGPLLLFLLATSLVVATGAGVAGEQALVVADAGSTGTRFHLYHMRPDVTRVVKVKAMRDGLDVPLSGLVGLEEEELRARLRPALAELATATETLGVPLPIPLLVLGTAGMRVVDGDSALATYAAVGKLVDDEFRAVFDVQPAEQRLRTLTGREEGFYAWLAANYLAPSPDEALSLAPAADGDADGSVGIIDLGGGSTQAVGLVDDAESSDQETPPQQQQQQLLLDTQADTAALARVPAALHETFESLYMRSHLGLGASHMERAVLDALVVAAAAGAEEILNPCGFPGRREVRDGGSADGANQARRVQLVGTGEHSACAILIQAQLQARAAAEEPALRLSASLREGTHWLGLSLLYHLTHFLAVTGDQLPSFPNPSLDQVRAAAEALCAVPWVTVERTMAGVDPNTPADRLRGRCFDGALVTTLLGDSSGLGYGLPAGRPVMTFVDEVAGMEVEWTLGVALSLADPALLMRKLRGERAAVVMAQGGWSQSRRSLSQGHHPHKQRQRRRERGKGQPVDYWKLGLGVAAIAGFGGYAVWKAYKSPRRIMGGRLISDHPVYSLARGRRRAEAP